jgi:hypothetical protein
MLLKLVNVINKLIFRKIKKTNTEMQFTHYIVISGLLKVNCVL